MSWNAQGSKKDKKGKISVFFVLFAFFASALPLAANPDFENVS